MKITAENLEDRVGEISELLDRVENIRAHLAYAEMMMGWKETDFDANIDQVTAGVEKLLAKLKELRS